MRASASLAILFLVSTPAAQSAIHIITPGSFHGDEVPADTPGSWFALVRDGGGASLQPVLVSVTAVRDEIVDDIGETTGRRVDVSPKLEALVLVKGLASLRPGPVSTTLVEQRIDETHLDAHSSNVSYRFVVLCGDTYLIAGQRQQECELRIRSQSVEQSLFTYGTYFEGDHRLWASGLPPSVVWAGDLDGDGRLDILLNTSNHENVNEMRLYLSSTATFGRLVSEVARFEHVGC
jgi:hypothetical protein